MIYGAALWGLAFSVAHSATQRKKLWTDSDDILWKSWHGPEVNWFRFWWWSGFLCGFWVICDCDLYHYEIGCKMGLNFNHQVATLFLAEFWELWSLLCSCNASLLLLCFQFLMIHAWSLCRSWLSLSRVSQTLSWTWHVCYVIVSIENNLGFYFWCFCSSMYSLVHVLAWIIYFLVQPSFFKHLDLTSGLPLLTFPAMPMSHALPMA